MFEWIFVLQLILHKDVLSLGLKCQSNSVVTSTVMKRRKSDENTKTLSWFVITKVYSLLHLLVVVEKRETEYELSRLL